jgi:hypothetical protein
MRAARVVRGVVTTSSRSMLLLLLMILILLGRTAAQRPVSCSSFSG